MTSINDLFSELMKTVMDAEDQLNDFLAQNPSPEELADAVVALHSMKNAFSDVYGMFSAQVMTTLQKANIEEMDAHGGKIEIKTSSDRKKWDHDKLINEVGRRLIQSSVDMSTGEVVLSTEDLLKKVLDYIQPSYWRVKELSKIGINADNYCEVGDYKTSIIVRKAK